MGITAILLGATGATGKELAKILIKDESFEQILIFTRRKTGLIHVKISETVCDLLDLEQINSSFKGDVVFCCIGTTMKKTPDKELYRKIDFGIPVAAAQLSKKNNIGCFLVMSSMGANSKSKIFYNRTKGEMEEGVFSSSVTNTYIFRPSLIAAKRDEKRLGEGIGKLLFSFLNKLMVGKLRKYRSITPLKIASAMVNVSKIGYHKSIISSDEIEDLGSL